MHRASGSMVKLAPPRERHPALLTVIAGRLRLKGVHEIIELFPEPDAERGIRRPHAPLTGSPPSPQRRRPDRLPGRRRGLVLAGCGVALLPWLFVLATSLPTTFPAPHWSAAWVGLDALEAVGLITTGLLATRADRRLAPAAAATAALLAVDAWFDTMTAAGGSDLRAALVMALSAELPLAAVCVGLAVRGLPRTP
ncbi:hypothetical protein ACIRBY_25245 [Streptomyces sp. NPDC096136]|uniref:hypothetical protein n=1 Tax=Streptomyces sp. NPDC096136 TaxID=3366076 RepID=UPI00381772E8